MDLEITFSDSSVDYRPVGHIQPRKLQDPRPRVALAKPRSHSGCCVGQQRHLVILWFKYKLFSWELSNLVQLQWNRLSILMSESSSIYDPRLEMTPNSIFI